MEITYIGHSSFKLKGKNVTIISDPFDPDQVGLKAGKQTADILTISHRHPDHSYIELVKPKGEHLMSFDAPGEYEVGGCSLQAWKTYHDAQKGELRGINTVFHYDIDSVKVVHLGDLGHMLSDEILENMGDVDVLLIPVGGHYTIDHKQAAQLISKISPRIVVPMHYFREGMNQELFGDLSGVELFLQEMNKPNLQPVDKLNVTAGSLGEETQVVLMN